MKLRRPLDQERGTDYKRGWEAENKTQKMM